MPNPTPEALVAQLPRAFELVELAIEVLEDRQRPAMAEDLDGALQTIKAALASREPAAQPEAAPAGGEAVDLIPWLYVIRSEFLPDDASLGRESDRKMRESLDWATNAMRDRAALSQSQSAQAGGGEVVWMFRGAEGGWHTFVNDKHREDTIADGRWEVRQFVPASPAAPAVPEGYALVPVEPTEAMRSTFRADQPASTYFTHTTVQLADFDSRYRAMLAAAQKDGA